MSEFGSASQRELEALISRHGTLDPADPMHRFAAARLIDVAGVFAAFRNWCLKSETLETADWENLETVFCVAEAMAEAGVTEVTMAGHRYGMSTILRDMQLWIWKIYQRLPAAQKQPEEDVDPLAYDRFFKLLRDHQMPTRTTVVTTNYDLVYEFFSWKNGFPCSYPIPWGDDFSVSHDPTPYLVHEGSWGSTTVVCKLHGSVNYFEGAVGLANDERLQVATDLGGGPSVGKSGGVVDRPALLALDAIWTLEKRFGANITPAIVPPSYAKLGRKDWLEAIWIRAREELTRAAGIVFIGYSLPATDGFMRSLFAGSAAMRDSGDRPAVIVVDPCEASFERIARVYGRSNVTWIPESFAVAVKNSLPNAIRANPAFA